MPLYNVQLSPVQASQLAMPGGSANYTLRVTNMALLTDSIAIQLAQDWPAIASPASVTLAPGAAAMGIVSVTVPPTVTAGSSGTVTVTAQSIDDTTRATAWLDTTAVAALHRNFLPLVRKN